MVHALQISTKHINKNSVNSKTTDKLATFLFCWNIYKEQQKSSFSRQNSHVKACSHAHMRMDRTSGRYKQQHIPLSRALTVLCTTCASSRNELAAVRVFDRPQTASARLDRWTLTRGNSGRVGILWKFPTTAI